MDNEVKVLTLNEFLKINHLTEPINVQIFTEMPIRSGLGESDSYFVFAGYQLLSFRRSDARLLEINHIYSCFIFPGYWVIKNYETMELTLYRK